MNLKGKVAIVTGASRGIGKAISLKLAEEGLSLVIFSRTHSKLKEFASQIESYGVKCEVVAGDVSKEPDVIKCIKHTTNVFGTLDVLVNCAGIAKPSSIMETTSESLLNTFNVNVVGAFLFMREAARFMTERRRGVIINIASVTGIKGYVNQGVYCASKHALVGLSRVMALEMKPLGVKVHTICPGAVDTNMIKDMRPDIPKEKLIRPEDIADIVSFLIQQPDSATIEEITVSRFKE
jgi:NAD(P)-dependent dehydrogenase (short-subunit alcohol dehydrogenase family)